MAKRPADNGNIIFKTRVLSGPGRRFRNMPMTALVLAMVIMAMGLSKADAAETLTCFGDSITKGSPYVNYSSGDGRVNHGGYEPVLHNLLSDAGLDFDALNYGLSSEHTVDGVNRLVGVLAAKSSKYVLLMEGSNDVHNGISPATTFANLRNMVDRCKSYGDTRIPLLSTLLPREDAPIPSYYNDEIKTIAAQKRILLVDQYQAFESDWDALNHDGVHPNRDGYDRMAETWSIAIIGLENGTLGNDPFSSAFDLQGISGQTTGNNLFATSEPGEPLHAGVASSQSVWWAWVAPHTGSVYFDTAGSDFDTVLAVYTGDALANLVETASNDDAEGAVATSRVAFGVQEGTRYMIAVDGGGGESGAITLAWSYYSDTCTDGDGDGFYTEIGCVGALDCNDNDDQIFPGAGEICCDAIDNDCNGQIDCDDTDSDCACGQTGVTVIQPTSYQVTDFVTGNTYYTDREYILTDIPGQLDTGFEHLISTRNDDKTSTAGDFLRFTVSGEATVYIGYDPRHTALPDWLANDFTPTALTIDVSDEDMSHFDVFARAVTAGEMVLGGNMAAGAAGADSNYIVVVQGTGQPIGCNDRDGDGLPDNLENTICTDPGDADTDDDGIQDGDEDVNHDGIKAANETDPCNIDTDGDGIQDGTELGVTDPVADPDGAGPLLGTDISLFQPDLDPIATTDPLDTDTDKDSLTDGQEDPNHNGMIDINETDPDWIAGDIDGNNHVNLNDAILANQVLSGKDPSAEVNTGADVNGDGKIGLADLLYILQKIGEVR